MVAANTSFQDRTKVKMADAVRPGRARGKATFINACARLQPNVNAASSNSRDTPIKMLLVTRIVTGRARAVWARATP